MKTSPPPTLRPVLAPPAVGLTRVVRAFWHSLAGLRAAWRHEAAIRQELIAAAIIVPVAFLLPVSLDRSLILVAALIPVLVVELLNSAVEALGDAVTEEYHPLIGRAKDLGSAAVLISMLGAVLVWLAVLV